MFVHHTKSYMQALKTSSYKQWMLTFWPS